MSKARGALGRAARAGRAAFGRVGLDAIAALGRAARAALATCAALVQPALAFEASVEFGLQAHRLRERDTAGVALVRERDTEPRIGLAAAQPIGETWSLHASIAGAAGSAHYDGRTQSGAPLESDTGTQSLALEATLRRALPALVGLDAEAGLQVERFRRRLHGAGGGGGFDERLDQARALLGIGWSDAGTSLRANLLWGPRAPLPVRFDDALYDPVSLRSGRALGWRLEARRQLGAASAWSAALQLEGLRVAGSLDAALTRNGVVVGSVSQPSWRRERIGLVLVRALR